MAYFNYLLFSTIYLYICNWFQIQTFVKHFSQPKSLIQVIRNEEISSLIKKKTGIKLKRIIIFNSDRLFGMMPGVPVWPKLILSSQLLKELNKDELEWVLLHEAAHCKLWHVPKTFLIQIFFLCVCLWLITLKQNLIIVVLLSLVLPLITIQGCRLLEWEADKFSITHVDNPQGVIDTQNKFKKINGDLAFYRKGIFRQLLFWNILPSQRIKLAKKRIERYCKNSPVKIS